MLQNVFLVAAGASSWLVEASILATSPEHIGFGLARPAVRLPSVVARRVPAKHINRQPSLTRGAELVRGERARLGDSLAAQSVHSLFETLSGGGPTIAGPRRCQHVRSHSVPPFAEHVVDVVRLRASEQMRRVAARTIVAVVADVVAIRNRTDVHLVRRPMSANRYRSPTLGMAVEDAVSRPLPSAREDPALRRIGRRQLRVQPRFQGVSHAGNDSTVKRDRRPCVGQESQPTLLSEIS